MEDKKRRQIEALRRSIKRRKNKASQGDPLEVEVQCGEDPSIDNSNLIHGVVLPIFMNNWHLLFGS